MQELLQNDWEHFLAAHNQQTPVSIRMNPRKAASSAGTHIPWTGYGYYLDTRPSFISDPLWHGGAYYVQEASSMLMEQAITQHLKKDTAYHVLDVSAAPGGKSTHVISLLNKDSLLVSNEIVKKRALILKENIQKWGYDNVVVTNNDPSDFSRLPGFFDVIIVDAPCSGEGLFRKDHEAAKHWSPEHVASCSKRQQNILHEIWPSLKTDGIVIYSTCTYNNVENEGTLQRFASAHALEFLALEVDSSWGIEPVTTPVTGYRCYPHKVKGEGFFLSVFRKKDVEESGPLKATKNVFGKPSNKIMDQVRGWIKGVDDKEFILRNDGIQFFPRSKTAEIQHLAQQLYLIAAGVHAGTIKHDKIIVEHPLALAADVNQDFFTRFDLPIDEAIKYLKKETIYIDHTKKEMALVTYQHVPIGWVNLLGNRVNNLYPSEWRIRFTK